MESVALVASLSFALFPRCPYPDHVGRQGRAHRRRRSRSLTLKWAFGFAGVNSARAQPAVAGGRLFVGSENGDVYALNAKTGCTYWTYHAQAGIRTAISVGPYKSANGASGFAVYFADGGATAYAVDATTGKEIWTRKVDDHTYAKSTGSPTFHDGRLYVPTAGVGEEGQGGRSQYQCCTFRGSVTALDANTGQPWRGSRTRSPKSRSRAARTRTACRRGDPPAAASGRRRRSTRGAARSTSRPATATPSRRSATTDAVLALDMDTGQDPLGQPAGAERRLGRRLQAGESRQPELSRRSSDPITTSRCRRCWPSARTGRTCSSCSRSRAWPTRSIPTSRARWCGNTAPVRAADSADSGARPPTTSRCTSASTDLSQDPGRDARGQDRHRRRSVVEARRRETVRYRARLQRRPGRGRHRHSRRRVLGVDGRRRSRATRAPTARSSGLVRAFRPKDLDNVEPRDVSRGRPDSGGGGDCCDHDRHGRCQHDSGMGSMDEGLKIVARLQWRPRPQAPRRGPPVMNPCRNTARRSRSGVIPSASRMPISRVRCTTAYDTTP